MEIKQPGTFSFGNHLKVRPLCFRYLVAVFNTVSIPLGDADHQANCNVQWALGHLKCGEYEVLGVWLRPNTDLEICSSALADLRARGVEFLDYGVDAGLDGFDGGLSAAFPRTRVLESLERAVVLAAASVPPRHQSAVVDGLRAAAHAGDQDEVRAKLVTFRNTSLGKRYADLVLGWEEALARPEALGKLGPPMKTLVRSVDRTAAEVHSRLTKAVHRHGPFVDAETALDFVVSELSRAEQRLDRARNAAPDAPGIGNLRPRGDPSMSGGIVGVPSLA